MYRVKAAAHRGPKKRSARRKAPPDRLLWTMKQRLAAGLFLEGSLRCSHHLRRSDAPRYVFGFYVTGPTPPVRYFGRRVARVQRATGRFPSVSVRELDAFTASLANALGYDAAWKGMYGDVSAYSPEKLDFIGVSYVTRGGGPAMNVLIGNDHATRLLDVLAAELDWELG